jgi:glycine/D-amino acid oxidase-like deaminating enzyme
VVEDTLSARLHPRMASAALVAAIRAKGGEVVLGEGADEGPVIWATGVQGLRDLTADLGRPVGDGVKGQAISLQFDARSAPQLYSDSLHIIPHTDGTVAIGSTSETVWETDTGTDSQLETIHARAIAALPVLAGAPVVERWAGIRPRAKTRAPLLGAWPGRPGEFVANGGFKIGFGMAPKVATTMVDLVLEGRDTIPDGFRL